MLLGLTRRAIVVAPALLLAALALGVSTPLATRMRSMVDPTDPTARERLYMWQAGLRMVRDAPLLGLGPGGVRQHYPEYRDPRTLRSHTGHLHNNLVQIAAERGLLGLLTWSWIWVVFFVRAGGIYRALSSLERRPRALTAGSIAAVAGFLVAGLFEYNFGDAEVLDLVWLIMAFPFVCEREATVAGRPAGP
jgi:O-antigen ligase